MVNILRLTDTLREPTKKLAGFLTLYTTITQSNNHSSSCGLNMPKDHSGVENKPHATFRTIQQTNKVFYKLQQRQVITAYSLALCFSSQSCYPPHLPLLIIQRTSANSLRFIRDCHCQIPVPQ